MTTFNPFAVTNVQDSFSVQSNGFWQGDLQSDPAGRFQLAAGVIDASETGVIWGGLPIVEGTPAATPEAGYMGSNLTLATTAAEISGFTVFNGSYSVPTTPQSPVPTAVAGNSFNFVRKGTNNRIVVKCSAAIIALAGSSNPQAFSWDFVNGQLISGNGTDEFTATLIQVDTNGAIVSYDGATGYATWNTTANVAVIQI
jgi:hypothetical protein